MKPHTSLGLTGVLAAIIAAIGYGLVPLFTLHINQTAPIEADRLGDIVILFYRFLFASLIIGGFMLFRRQDFRISFKELGTIILLASLSNGSALFNIAGFQHISSGIATTIRFFYPVFTTLIMIIFYKETCHRSTLLAMLMAVAGVVVLSFKGDTHAELQGIILEILSAFCMAFYLVYVARSRVNNMDGLKLTFYVLFIGALIFGTLSIEEENFQLIQTTRQWNNLLLAAIFCTALTNLCLIFAVKRIGSTTTAVLGALEPLTAVVIGAIFFAETITPYTLIGMAIIIPAVLIIILSRKTIKS